MKAQEGFGFEGGSGQEGALSAIRPGLPLVFFVAAGLWAGIGAAYLFLEAAQPPTMLACLLACLVGALGAGIALWRTRYTAIACVLVGLCLGGVCGCVAALDYARDCAAALQQPAQTCEFRVVEDAKQGDFGASCCAETTLANGRTIKVRVNFAADDAARDATDDAAGDTTDAAAAHPETLYRFGQRFRTQASFCAPSQTAAHYYYQQGIAARVSADSVQRSEPTGALGVLLAFRQSALASFDGYSGEGTAFLRAVLFGERGGLDEGGFYAAVKACGLAHIIAVSGAHLVVVSSFIGLFLRALRLNLWATVAVQVLFIGCYLVFTGLPISAIRAALMSLISMTAVFAHRRSSGLSALSLCVCILLVASPQAAFSVSFALSVAATCGIVIFGGLASNWCAQCLGLRPGFVRDALAMTLAANLLTLPLAAAVFAQISLIAPVANVLASALFALFCGGGLLAVILFLLLPAAGSFVLGCFVVAAQAFCEGVMLLARIPFAAIPFSGNFAVLVCASVLVAAVLWRVWPKPSRRVAAAGCALALVVSCLAVVVAPRLAPDELIMLDVGQGDAFLLRSQGATLLVDTGNQDAALLRGLARRGVYHLDAVLITHPDSDHCDSLAALQNIVSVDKVLVAADALSCTCQACTKLRAGAVQVVGEDGLQGVHKGDTLRFGVFSARAVWPQAFAEEGGNADSLCLALDADCNADGTVEWRALLCGDAEQPQIAALIEQGEVGDIDIYKVGHHGSKHALGQKEAAVLRPEIALYSVGAHNRYGHPAAETVALLEAGGATTFRSDTQGEVVCRLRVGAIEVETLR
ncbi:MAG: DNA internalization-related competence protein ComEC/Rec2 [Raoultibacter sp.]